MYKRIVVKVGTNVLFGGRREVDQAWMVDLVRQCAALHHAGHELIITSSGAIAMGRLRLGFPELPNNIVTKQMLASAGQSRLMLMWERFFDIYKIHVGQILLTRADVENRHRYLNARDTFSALLEQRIIPIVNENDAVAPEEIKVGDNDNLSALVTTLTNADLLMLLTDQPGLFTADPRTHPDATLIPLVSEIDAEIRAIAGSSSTGVGVGGMITKVEAANIARHGGAEVVICAGSEPDVVKRVVAGESIGTRFPAVKTPLESHKRWILAGSKPAGDLIVDAGAATALRVHGRSLLPAGVRRVVGDFERGDTVLIKDPAGRELARGIVAYASEDLKKIAGVHSDSIEALLGYSYGSTVVHRNFMSLLSG